MSDRGNSARLFNRSARASSPILDPSALSNDRIEDLVAMDFPNFARPRNDSTDRATTAHPLPLFPRSILKTQHPFVRPIVSSESQCLLVCNNLNQAQTIRRELGDAAVAELIGDFLRKNLPGSTDADFSNANRGKRRQQSRMASRWLLGETPQEHRIHSLLLVGEAAGMAVTAWRSMKETDPAEELRVIFKKMAMGDSSSKTKRFGQKIAGLLRRN